MLTDIRALADYFLIALPNINSRQLPSHFLGSNPSHQSLIQHLKSVDTLSAV